MKQIKKENIKKIFLLRLDRLGDVLLSIPAVRNIRQNFPASRISLMVDKNFSGILNFKDYVDEVIGIDIAPFTPLHFFEILRLLRKEKYDFAIDLMTVPNNLSSWIMFFLNSQYKCGGAVGLRKYFLNLKVSPATEIKYETECVFDILREIGLNVENENFALKYTDEDNGYVLDWFRKNNIMPGEFLIGIHPGVGKGRPGKAWQVEKFSALGRLLKDKYNAKIVITGSKEEIDTIKELQKSDGSGFYFSAGQFNISQLIALISRFKLFIVNNTGPMHIAFINKIPAVVISGFSSMKRWGINSNLCRVVQKDYACIPCEGKLRDCKTSDYRCIKGITVEEVFNAAVDLIKAVNL